MGRAASSALTLRPREPRVKRPSRPFLAAKVTPRSVGSHVLQAKRHWLARCAFRVDRCPDAATAPGSLHVRDRRTPFALSGTQGNDPIAFGCDGIPVFAPAI
jgi:hypothetical protein